MATAYKVALVVQRSNGQRKMISLAGDDTSGNALTFDSGETNTTLSNESVTIVDYIDGAASVGTTTYVTMYVNGATLPFKILRGANLATTIARQVAGAPIFVPAGAVVKFIQTT